MNWNRFAGNPRRQTEMTTLKFFVNNVRLVCPFIEIFLNHRSPTDGIHY
jgi:hypothetical protein